MWSVFTNFCGFIRYKSSQKFVNYWIFSKGKRTDEISKFKLVRWSDTVSGLGRAHAIKQYTITSQSQIHRNTQTFWFDGTFVNYNNPLGFSCIWLRVCGKVFWGIHSFVGVWLWRWNFWCVRFGGEQWTLRDTLYQRRCKPWRPWLGYSLARLLCQRN